MTSRGARAAVVAVLAVLHLGLAVAPALAHGVPTAGPPNWQSRITDVDAVDGVAWSIVGVDAALRLDNASGVEVQVPGYGGEPFLRIGPDGVFENRRSLSTWLSRDRYGDLTGLAVPDDVGPGQAPDWQRVGEGSSWTWLDHRIHWMSPLRLPPGVEEDPTATQVVDAWEVPATRDGEPVGIAGELLWRPTPPLGRVPWLLPVVAAVALGAATWAAGRDRRVATGVAGALVVVALVGAWHEVGTLRDLGPAGAGTVDALVRSGAVGAVAVAALAVLLRGDRWARPFLVVAAIVVAVVVGGRELEVLATPVPRSPLPGPVAQALVAVALALPVPALAVAARRPV